MQLEDLLEVQHMQDPVSRLTDAHTAEYPYLITRGPYTDIYSMCTQQTECINPINLWCACVLNHLAAVNAHTCHSPCYPVSSVGNRHGGVCAAQCPTNTAPLEPFVHKG